MRWNCPHCNASLSVPEMSAGLNWACCRCTQCNGFALVRAPEVSPIQLNKPQQVEGTMPASPAPILAAPALAVPTIKRAEQRPAPTVPVATPQFAAQVAAPEPAVYAAAAAIPPAFQGIERSQPVLAAIPEPLPPISRSAAKPRQVRALPIAITLAGATAVASGFYLYQQGLALWETAQRKVAQQIGGGVETLAAHVESAHDRGAIPETPKSADEPLTLRADEIAQTEELTLSRAVAVQAPNAQESSPLERASVTAPIAPESDAPAETAPVAKAPEANPAKTPEPEASARFLRVRSEFANARSGPGLTHAVVATLPSHAKLRVLGWEGMWFRIELGADAIRKPQHGKKTAALNQAWIRNDLVQMAN